MPVHHVSIYLFVLVVALYMGKQLGRIDKLMNVVNKSIFELNDHTDEFIFVDVGIVGVCVCVCVCDLFTPIKHTRNLFLRVYWRQ